MTYYSFLPSVRQRPQVLTTAALVLSFSVLLLSQTPLADLPGLSLSFPRCFLLWWFLSPQYSLLIPIANSLFIPFLKRNSAFTLFFFKPSCLHFPFLLLPFPFLLPLYFPFFSLNNSFSPLSISLRSLFPLFLPSQGDFSPLPRAAPLFKLASPSRRFLLPLRIFHPLRISLLFLDTLPPQVSPLRSHPPHPRYLCPKIVSPI